jgi:hypothetical protein
MQLDPTSLDLGETNTTGCLTLANGGDCPDCDGGTTVDRVLALTQVYQHQLALAPEEAGAVERHLEAGAGPVAHQGGVPQRDQGEEGHDRLVACDSSDIAAWRPFEPQEGADRGVVEFGLDLLALVEKATVTSLVNGGKITLVLADADFTMRAAEAGLQTIYLQFDGVDDRVYEQTRGRKLLSYKLKTVEAVRKATGEISAALQKQAQAAPGLTEEQRTLLSARAGQVLQAETKKHHPWRWVLGLSAAAAARG